MRINLSLVGQDILKVMSVLTVIAKTSEPIVDLARPDVAQIYNLSADEGVAVISAFLGAPQQASSPAPAPAAAPAPAPSPAVAAPVQATAPVAPAHAAVTAEPVIVGPGLHNVVPA